MIHKYRAKGLVDDKWYEGYYFEMPFTTYCFATDTKNPTRYFIIDYRMTDWGLPNEMVAVEINIDTLEEA